MSQVRLFDRKLLVISGKGGVGKSTIAAALALVASRRGKKVLVVEMDTKERISAMFNAPPVGEDQVEIYPGIWALNLNPEEALEEYLMVYVRIKRVYKRIFNNPVMKYFLAAAPGFKELLTIGKVWYLSQLEEGRPKRPRYDLIIVDAPALGHGVSFLGVPRAVVDMVRMGPIKTQSQKIVDLLEDPKRTLLNIVALPEEMPVNEAVELAKAAQDPLKMAVGCVFMNEVFQEVISPKDKAALDKLKSKTKGNSELKDLMLAAERGRKKREMSLKHIEKLRQELPYADIAEIPYIFTSDWDLSAIKEVAREIDKQIT